MRLYSIVNHHVNFIAQLLVPVQVWLKYEALGQYVFVAVDDAIDVSAK